MNKIMENVFEILKQLPKGTEVYFVLTGHMEKVEIIYCKDYPLTVGASSLTPQGQYFKDGGECVIFPSIDHRTWEDWREFYGMSKLQPKFKPFDRVLVRDAYDQNWIASLFSHYEDNHYPYVTISGSIWKKCIPYEGNEHLVGTTDSPK